MLSELSKDQSRYIVRLSESHTGLGVSVDAERGRLSGTKLILAQALRERVLVQWETNSHEALMAAHGRLPQGFC